MPRPRTSVSTITCSVKGSGLRDRLETLTASLCMLLSGVALLLYSPSSHAARSCEAWHAVLLSVEGTVELQRSSSSEWQDARQGDAVCSGDVVRVQSYSRAAVQLPDRSMLRLDQNTSLAFSEPADGIGSLLDLLRGIVHVISRDPRELRFTTPYANAGLEGTEFTIQVADDETDVTVLEGEVVMSNEAGHVTIESGQRGSARSAGTPAATAVEPLASIRWASYFAPILDDELPAPDQTPAPAEGADPDFYTARAARRLAVGRLEEARTDLALALSLDPRDGVAQSLQSLIALSENRKDEALALARTAVGGHPDAVAPRIALSYAQQARSDLDGARASLERAVQLDASNAPAWARLAEVRLATGDFDGTLEAAGRAATLKPDLAHAQSVLGFAHLSQTRTQEAIAAFRCAIGLDQASPLPRLGLALALVRQNRLDEGREQLEAAVLHDPANALARSYMAKIYDAEHRDELSESQLALAKTLDPLDPTPWLYDALRKQNKNRPVEALQDLQAAIDRNDSRPVYRSQLLVDEDLAVRSAGQGRLHRQLGFGQLALVQGWESVWRNPADYAGHRLLADVYSTLPRHQIARGSELLQAQLLQPINVTPIQPQLAEPNLFILDSVGPSDLAFSELGSLVSKNGLRFQGSAVIAARGTAGEDLVLSGLYDRVSYSIGQFHFATDGFRDNNDLDQSTTNAFVQYRPSHDTSVQAEFRSTDTEKGDLRMLFDGGAFSASQRQVESVDSMRLGMRHDLSDHATLLSSVILQQAAQTLTSEPSFSLDARIDGYSADVQLLRRTERWRISSGLTYLKQDRLDGRSLAFAPVPSLTHNSYSLEQATAYTYASFAPSETIILTVGGTVDQVQGQLVQRNRFNPKLGLIWKPTRGTTVRAAALETLQGPLVSKYHIQPRLEPVQVAGFTQVFFGSEAEEASRYGLGIDHEFSRSLYGGIELSKRATDVPVSVAASPLPLVVFTDAEEQLQRGYLYWAPRADLSFSGEYRSETLRNNAGVDGFTHMRIRRLPLRLNYFNASGLSAGVGASYVREHGHFSSFPSMQQNAFLYGEDEFWVFDLSLGYRLPRRRGLLSLNVDNLLDEGFRFQDTDPENPRILPERMVYFRFTLAFE